ncbi:MAG: hypothetical protein VYA34_03645 [Myxococcota bacterium]|nr:hypothetical protein [Myxococcota bacterium]
MKRRRREAYSHMLALGSQKVNVLLTGGRAPVTLELSRLLSAAGHKVFVAESLPLHICHFSNTVTSNLHIPAPNSDLDGFGEALSKIINEYNIDYLIPTCEEVFHVSRVMSKLPERCNVFTDTIEKLRKLHSKKEFMEYASSFGLPVPETRRVTSMKAVHQKLATGEDFVLKKVFSRFSSDTILLPKTPQDVEGIEIGEDTPWVIQEYLGKKQFCTYSIVVKGKIQGHGTYPTTYTAGQGASTYFESVQPQEIYEWIEKFVGAIEYTGQISFDFMETSTGKILPIECNPRATSGAHLFAPTDNIDHAFFGSPSKPIFPASNRPSMVGIGMALYGIPAAIKTRSVMQWFADWRKARDVVFSTKDPVPVLGQFFCYMVFSWLALKSGNTILAASTIDIEWNGKLSPGEQSTVENQEETIESLTQNSRS